MSTSSTIHSEKLLNDTERLVVRHLKRTTKLMGAYDIQNALRIRYPNTVYRALERLSQLGLVHRVESKNAFIACVDSNRSHRPGFIICADCGAVREFCVEPLLPLLQSEAADRKYEIETTTIELVGRCNDCARHPAKNRLSVR
jgi:Fur family zinc uptake transcriptional regulator